MIWDWILDRVRKRDPEKPKRNSRKKIKSKSKESQRSVKIPVSKDSYIAKMSPSPDEDIASINIGNANGVKKQRRGSFSSLFRKRRWSVRKRRNSLSASFNINDADFKVERINVNQATEEELMTLRGVNRILAKNIVNHRNIIGGYKKVEDLALVSGMGANRLEAIRGEIFLGKRSNLSLRLVDLSQSSSKTGSNSSLNTLNTTSRPLNINRANIFDLMSISGLNQALSARIINYRDKIGGFKSLDQLRHVGLSWRKLGCLRDLITLEDSEDNSSVVSTMSHKKIKSNIINITTLNNNVNYDDTLSIPQSSNNEPPISSDNENNEEADAEVEEENEQNILNSNYDNDRLKEIFELMNLLSMKSSRPDIETYFYYKFEGKDAIRLASWNLEGLNIEKYFNVGVREVLFHTIRDFRFSLITLQGIEDLEAAEKLVSDLSTRLKTVWKIRSHVDSKKNNLSIIYDTERIDAVHCGESDLSLHSQNTIWQLNSFDITIKDFKYKVVNINSYENDGSKQNGFAHQIKTNENSTIDNSMIFIGNFDCDQFIKAINRPNLCKIGNNENSAIFVSENIKNRFVDSGECTSGLTHLAIPKGKWSWGGRATESNPFWTTLLQSEEKMPS